MINVRPAAERGHFHHGWLDTHHTFSFGEYRDPGHMGFRTLRVLNDDTVAPGAGFGTHSHADMEIVSYVVEGALEHRDSLGTGSVLRPGDVQRMTAGTGVTHSEFNHSAEDPLRFLQIWILPERRGLEPGYEERHFPAAEREGALRCIASPDGADGSLRVHQDVNIHAGLLRDGESVTRALPPGRHAWVQVVNGRVMLNGTALGAGDGAAVEGEPEIRLTGASNGAGDGTAELLVFDLG